MRRLDRWKRFVLWIIIGYTMPLTAAVLCDNFEPESTAQMALLERAFAHWMTEENAAVPTDFERRIEASGEHERLLERSPCRGRGEYMLRRGASLTLLLQAPHRYHDLATGRIALRLFRDYPVRLLALNSAARRNRPDGAIGGDVAHLDATAFQAATAAFVESFQHAVVLQLHGFDPAKRRTQAAATAAAIVSDGSRHPSPRVQRFSRCLATRWAQDVRLFPYEVTELGGTGNAQGRLLRRLGSDALLHLELSPALRQRLIDQPAARAALFHCAETAISE